MCAGQLVFSQVMDFVPMHIFRQCVARYRGNFKVLSFTCLDQYLCMAIAQVTYQRHRLCQALRQVRGENRYTICALKRKGEPLAWVFFRIDKLVVLG